jgi:hypothetical protein
MKIQKGRLKMKKMLRSGWMVSILLAALVCVVSVSHADTITTNHVFVEDNGVLTSYDFDQVKMEMEDGKTNVCICKCLCFRALQLLATQFADGVIPRDDIKIYTGWTTDGPEELFLEVMGWPASGLAFMERATDATHLTIEDAYFFFVQHSTGKVWKVRASAALYPKEFFTYRSLVKTGQATDEQKSFFQKALRPQAVANMESLPLIDKLDIQEVAFFGGDGVLRVPVLSCGGVAYEVELTHTDNYVFVLGNVTPLN